MINRSLKLPISLKASISIFIVLWLIIAAFPFIWTLWGSFKIEADFFSKADCGVTINRPNPAGSNQTDVHIWKCRYSWIGKQGDCSFLYDKI